MRYWLRYATAGFLVLAAAMPAMADDGDGWTIKNKVDEEVRFRDNVGLSKMRTLGQSDIDKKLNGGETFSSLKLHTTLRASYDKTYDVNPKFGANAGGSVAFKNNSGGYTTWGSAAAPWGGLANGNNNQGMALVDGWREPDGGLAFATPVRPCDVDSRGCIKGYMDSTKNELAAPEFNDRLDFIRELYVDGEVPVGNNTLALRFGRQQLVWGRSDLFRVLDVINPVDYSRNSIYDELSDTRIPMGMLRADYRMGARGPFDDINFQSVWVWEKFRPNNLGQGGSTNNPGGAGAMFRAMNNCWENGCTVGNYNGQASALTFAPHMIGIRRAEMPEWNLGNTTIGGKIEGELKGVGFSLNALHTRSQMPVLKGGVLSVGNRNGNSASNNEAVWPYAPAFDIIFPRISVFGGSADFTAAPIDTAFRVESTYTTGEMFADNSTPDLVSKSDVIRYVFGADRNTFMPFLGTNNAFLISGQLFGQHIVNHHLERTATGGLMGMVDWEDSWIGTMMIKGWYAGQTISPQIVFAHDFKAESNVIEPSVEWIPAAMWRFRLGSNIKFGQYHQAFSTNADGTPWGSAPARNVWQSGQPYGNLRNGLLGEGHAETEVFANATLRF